MSSHVLPSKVFVYLRRLLLNYETLGPKELIRVVKHAHIAIIEETELWSDFGEDSFGHDVVFFLPPEIIAHISTETQGKLADKLKEDISECAKSIAQEHVHAVRIEMVDENDHVYQSARMLTGKPPVDPETLSFWKSGQLRLFVSHRDTHKVEAHALAERLEQFGISCFVAHDHIEPTEPWQREIERALETMEVFLALVTPNFHDSVWTNQEVGFAKSRDVPILCLKLGAAPRGFIADKQAIQGVVGHAERSANEIYKVLRDKLKITERLQGAAITAFCEAVDFNDIASRFDRMDQLVERLSKAELKQIRDAYAGNEQLQKAWYLTNKYQRLENFLKKTTGEKFVIGKGEVLTEKEAKARARAKEVDDEIPF